MPRSLTPFERRSRDLVKCLIKINSAADKRKLLLQASQIIHDEPEILNRYVLSRLEWDFISNPIHVLEQTAYKKYLPLYQEYNTKALAKISGLSIDEIHTGMENSSSLLPEQEKLIEQAAVTISMSRTAIINFSNFWTSLAYLTQHIGKRRRAEDKSCFFLRQGDKPKGLYMTTLYFFSTHPEIQPFDKAQFSIDKVLKTEDISQEIVDLPVEMKAELFAIFDRLDSFYEAHERELPNDNSREIALIEAFIKDEIASGNVSEYLPIAEITEPSDLYDLYNLPSSPIVNLVIEGLDAGSNMADIPARKRAYSRAGKYTVSGNEQCREIKLETQTSQITLTFSDISKITGDKSTTKMFVYILIMGNKQAIRNGILTQDSVTFSLDDLKEAGIYKDIRAARRGFWETTDRLTSIKIKGKVHKKGTKKGKSEDIINQAVDAADDNDNKAMSVLFTDAIIQKNQCTVYLNPRVNWSLIAQFFTILPHYYFKLQGKAPILLLYIFYLARMPDNERMIHKQGFFTIKLRAVHSRMNLPNEDNNENPKRTIKEPIEAAIAEIEDRQKICYPGNNDFKLEIVYPPKANIKRYLDEGILKVYIAGTFAQRFIDLSKKSEQAIQDKQEKQARIAENAQTAALAKKIEAEQKQKDTNPR